MLCARQPIAGLGKGARRAHGGFPLLDGLDEDDHEGDVAVLGGVEAVKVEGACPLGERGEGADDAERGDVLVGVWLRD